MSRTAALRDLYNKISVLDFNNGGEPWDELTDEQRAAATAAIEELLPPLIEKPSGLPFKIVGTEAARAALDWLARRARDSVDEDAERSQHAAMMAATNEDVAALEAIVAHRAHLDKQVTGLQTSNTELLMRCRSMARVTRPAEAWTTIGALRQGAMFLTRDGVLAVKSEYHYPNGGCQVTLLASGEYGHFGVRGGNHDAVEVVEIEPGTGFDLGNPVKITISAGKYGPIASLADGRHEQGEREWDAIGRLVSTFQRDFNTEIVWPAEPASHRPPTEITVIRREHDWQARLDERRWEAGASEEGAIAKLVISRGAELGIRVVFTRGGASA